MTVLALHYESVKTQHPNSYSQHIVSNWHLNSTQILFAENFSFTQFLSPLCVGNSCYRFNGHEKNHVFFCFSLGTRS